MKTIYKYPLKPGACDLTLPVGAKILTAAAQGDGIFIWAEVDPEASKCETRHIHTYATGEPLEETVQTYIGTAFLYGGSLVFHVYEQFPY